MTALDSSARDNSTRTKPLTNYCWNPTTSLIKKPKGARKLAAECRAMRIQPPQPTMGGLHLASNAVAQLHDGGKLAATRRPPTQAAPAMVSATHLQSAILAQAQQMAAQAMVPHLLAGVLLGGQAAVGASALGTTPTSAVAPAPRQTNLQALSHEIQRLREDEAKLSQAAAASALVFLQNKETTDSGSSTSPSSSRPCSPIEAS